ncbi:MAG: phosphotransferase [Salinivirgaceae bacterium]|nr:phosphotransferase [Salinivirgaceae bacterium]MDD4745672.1 phosphotransferase [Salinivirgaceae bacterium]MDY0280927.1 phosphotransferase [Salinivirgaceae bacterium]
MEIIKFSEEQILDVLQKFGFNSGEVKYYPLGIGHINQSWIVESKGFKYILQYINPYIFSSIEVLTRNFRTISEYLKTAPFWETLKTPELYPTKENNYLLVTEKKYNWRMINYIEHDANYKHITSETQAYEAAKAYGSYAKCLSYLPISDIGQTILNFHDPEARIIEFGKALNEDIVGRRKMALPEIDFIRNNSEYARKVSKLITSSIIPTRITHNNTALDNLLWRENKICAIVDLDTTMPSTLLYDFGDMVRTYTSPIIDEATNSSDISVQCNIVCAIIEGYLESTAVFMTPMERSALFEGALMVIYIQAVRYMTDYLKDDPYYPINYPEQNLDRVRNHFELFRQILGMENEIRKLL